MKLEKINWITIIAASAMVIFSLIFLRTSKLLYFLVGIAAFIVLLPFLLSLMLKVSKEKEKEEMFLEFSRSLVESIRSGIPISRSIINIRNKDFGTLSPHIKKLANQIALGIPVKDSMRIFASDINNPVISRSVELIIEAEHSGGQIENILESVAKSVSEIEEIKKERKASIYNLVVEGYLIFFIFLIIMLVVEYKFLPQMIGTIATSSTGVGTGGIPGVGKGLSGGALEQKTISNLFFALIVIQGFFAGLVIGKLSEGKMQAGLKHSFILTAVAYLLTTFIGIFVK